MDKKELIISLIRDDLVSSKLVNGLNAIGLNPKDYFLHLSETIFKLMGFEDSMVPGNIYAHYLDLTRRVKYVGIAGSDKQLEKMAHEIYLELSTIKTCSYAGR